MITGWMGSWGLVGLLCGVELSCQAGWLEVAESQAATAHWRRPHEPEQHPLTVVVFCLLLFVCPTHTTAVCAQLNCRDLDAALRELQRQLTNHM